MHKTTWKTHAYILKTNLYCVLILAFVFMTLRRIMEIERAASVQRKFGLFETKVGLLDQCAAGTLIKERKRIDRKRNWFDNKAKDLTLIE